MRILYASERPPYPLFLGGAARCAHLLLRGMASELGVDCAAVGSSDYAVTPWAYPRKSEFGALGVVSVSLPMNDARGGAIDCGYPVHTISDFAGSLGRFIDSFKPDIVWAQLEGAREVLAIAHRKGVRGLYYVHDAEFDPAELRAIAALDTHIVCSSRFLADKAQRAIGRPPQVVYPPAELYFDTMGDTDGYVTMINPHRVKGLETFLEIARRLPAVEFLLLESWKLDDRALATLQQQLTALPNVRFQHRVSDMRTIYRQTRLLLVPSRWEEGFGMVAIEAQSCRIPVIASARGGLPESVGDGGILIGEYLDVDAWLRAIGQVLGDASAYLSLAERAHRHAASDDFSPPVLARRLRDICASEPVGTGPLARSLHAARLQIERLPVLGRLMQRTGQ
jgi:glycosyltransferase involved in cell wall biosynthesis